MGTTINSLESLLLANFERASTWSFSAHGTSTNSNFLKDGINFMINFRYAAIFLLIISLFTFISLASLRLARRASYFFFF